MIYEAVIWFRDHLLYRKFKRDQKEENLRRHSLRILKLKVALTIFEKL